MYKNIFKKNYNTLKNHNDLKIIFTNISKKPSASQLVKNKSSKRARTDKDLEADESIILIVNEKETSKDADRRKGNIFKEILRTFISIDKVFLLIKLLMLFIMSKSSTISNSIVVIGR